MNTGIIPLLSAIISMIFAVTVLDQFFAKRKPYQLVWAIGLFLYFLGAAAEYWMENHGIGIAAYRLWYLSGAILVAAYLGMGTLYLLIRRSLANVIMAVLAVITVYAAYSVFTADINLGVLQHLSGEAMPAGVRLMTPFLNIFGTLALVGGAIYSAWIFLRKRIMRHRVVSNFLVAAGAILPAVGGTSLRLGNPSLFYAMELAGVTIIFIGFLTSVEVFSSFRIPFIHGFKKIQTNS